MNSVYPSLLTISSHPKEFCRLLGQFLYFYPLPRYIYVPGLFGQPNIANILSWHYLWDPYGGFGHDGRRIQPVLPSLPSAISNILPVWDNFRFFNHFQDIQMFLDCLANLILPISCHGINFGTHMEALDMMGEEFSLPFPPYHHPS